MLKTVIIKDKYSFIKNSLKDIYDELDESGNVFILFQNEYDKEGNLLYTFLDIIEESIKLGFDYINTIVAPIEKMDDKNTDNVLYLIWICKNYNKMYFNKDAIRERHIWKDVEWGKRAKNYNPKGKDPGNVWIPTEDDGKGKITKHILLSVEELINRILNATIENSKTDTAKIYMNQDINLEEINDEMQPVIKIVYDLTDKCNNGHISSNDHTVCKSSSIQSKELVRSIIFGTSEEMPELEDNSINLIVTSPPYWDLKDYFKKGQIGQEPYDKYLSRMEKVWNECYKKLKPTGSLWININIRKIKNKPILLPKEFIRQCTSIGYYFKGILIWHKSSGIPTHAKNIVDRHEYVLIFSKDIGFSVNKGRLQKYSDYKNPKINGGMFWNINRKAGSVGKKFIHPAIYPNELVSRIVEVGTDEYDFVMDPFLGSGTSLIASTKLNRNFIGYEYNEGFKDLMKHRFNNEISESMKHIKYIKR